MAKLRILYLAMGASDALHAQARYAMLSALAWSNTQQQIHLLTDAPERYQALAELAHGHIAVERLNHATGAGIFQLKLSVIQRTAAEFAGDALLFCDADTFFVQPYSSLYARLLGGEFFMHRREYDISTHPTSQMRKFRLALRDAELLAQAGNAAMWNSGVVGLPPGRAEIIDTALATFTRLSPHTKKQYLAEQFSLSHALASQGAIIPAEDWIFHYWYQKADYTQAITQRMEPWAGKSLSQISAELQQCRISLPAPPQKLHWWEQALAGAGLGKRPPEIRGIP